MKILAKFLNVNCNKGLRDLCSRHDVLKSVKIGALVMTSLQAKNNNVVQSRNKRCAPSSIPITVNVLG